MKLKNNMMKRLVILFFLSVLIVPISRGQSDGIIAQGTGNEIYLDYVVNSGDNYYSVGRLFNVDPNYLASFNNLTLDRGLSIRQKLKIPLTSLNFTKTLFKSSSEALVPVYHIIQPSETLFRLGNGFGDSVPLAEIREWNQMTDNSVKLGQPYIIGFLKVSKEESSLAGRDFTDKIAADRSNSVSQTSPAGGSAPAATTPEPQQPTPVVVKTISDSDAKKEGFFKTEFPEDIQGLQISSVSGAASVFKSTSGWQDGKYYCFSDDIKQGSVVKISREGDAKTIYAKVLDGIPDIQQNAGLRLVLSNAAASALGVEDNQFDATVQFYK